MRPSLVASTALALALLAGCGGGSPSASQAAAAAAPAPEARPAYDLTPSQRIWFMPRLGQDYAAPGTTISQAQVDLGRKLYHDPRLSRSRTVSCNTCHPLDRAGADGLATSSGHKKQRGKRNAPTTLNAAGQVVQFWDGRAKDVEEQAKGPILNPVEMAHGSADECMMCVTSVPGYVEEFKKAFPGEASPMSYDNLARAIGAFERKLVARSRWDAYLAGDKGAITEEEKRGAATFIDVGCTTCHAGTQVGGQLYKVAGLVHPWPSDKDLGRFEITHDPADRMVFKVPALRNVTRTGPYFHDGSVERLDEAVRMMAYHQLGKDLTAEQIAGIISFLRTLEGDPPKELLAVPELPPDGPSTPKGEAG